MVIEIALTRGMVALVDEADYPLVDPYSWQAAPARRTFYAKRGVLVDGIVKTIRMHRQIIGVTDTKISVDHRDGNGLNNCRDNLRIGLQSQNSANNTRRVGEHSQYKGVTPFGRKWRARLDGKNRLAPVHIGLFQSEIDAAAAFDAANRELHGEFGTYNFPLPGERSALTGQIMPLVVAA